MASFRALMRSLTAAFLLLLGSATNGRAHISAHRHHSSHPGVSAANPSALLAATPQWKHVDTARPQFLASEASLHHRRVQSAPAPTRDSVPVCSCERTTGQAARPPPFHA
jgi:predicted nucleotidyltransferase